MITDREYRIVEPNEGEGWIFQSWWKAVNDPTDPKEVCHSTQVCMDDRHMLSILLSHMFTFTPETDIRKAVDDLFDAMER